MKEFAPQGANSFLEEWTSFYELLSPEKQTEIHVVPLSKTDGKHGGKINIIFGKGRGGGGGIY